MMKKMELLKRWFPLVLILIFMGAAYQQGLHEYISLELLKENKEILKEVVMGSPVASALKFIGLYIVFVALSLPAATLLTLAGGFLFGAWLGTLYVVVAATIGATVIFIVARSSLGQTLREKAGNLYEKIEKNMKENAIGYLFFMRLVPIFPFFLVNIVPALFNVRTSIYIVTTFFGIIPGTFVYVNLGQQLGEIENLKDLVSFETLIAFALLGLFSLVPTFLKFLKKAKKSTLSLIIVFSLSLFSYQANATTPYEQFSSLYNGLLKEHVRIVEDHPSQIIYNGVDYEAWSQDARYKEAKEMIALLNATDFPSQTHKKVFWINLYNFLTIDLIITEQETDSIKNLGSFFSSAWTYYTWTIQGKDYSLDHIEHEILRPMKDARIHFALNCASISCPDLRREIYLVETLNRQFLAQITGALSNTKKGFYEDDHVIYISKIFDWYKEDFKKGNISEWISHYKKIKATKDIRFLDYNWSLNKVR